jgi:hypothetical protein
LIQEYGALTFEEIKWVLKFLMIDVDSGAIPAYLLCAKAVGWITESRKGIKDFYVARDLPAQAATITIKDDAEIRDKARRRLLIREHWAKSDSARDRAIKENLGGGKKWAS